MENLEKSFTDGNNKFQWKLMQGIESIDIRKHYPKYPILILTCMDPRIDVHRIFQLEIGSVFVLRNAGNVVTEDVIRSILIAINEYNIKHIIILGHLDCAMKSVHMNELRAKLDTFTLKKVYKTSTNLMFGLRKYFRLFVDEIANMKNQNKNIKDSKAIPSEIQVIQMLYDHNTGWIFNEDDLKNYTFYDSFKRDYIQILQNKKLKSIDYFEQFEDEIVRSKDSYTINPSEAPEEQSNLEKEQNIPDESSILTSISEESPEIEGNRYSKDKLFVMPKIQVPKIYIPKIKVYMPNIKKRT